MGTFFYPSLNSYMDLLNDVFEAHGIYRLETDFNFDVGPLDDSEFLQRILKNSSKYPYFEIQVSKLGIVINIDQVFDVIVFLEKDSRFVGKTIDLILKSSLRVTHCDSKNSKIEFLDDEGVVVYAAQNYQLFSLRNISSVSIYPSLGSILKHQI